ncbi:MAG: hypothetical protein IKS24_07410 [Bacteroidaceae bacterium]|nr:hypothetical protein [Bacteroidaceae bacterium]
MKRYSVSALLSIACAMTVQAQTNNELPSRSMTVEGDYNPVFTEAAKIMPSPRKEEETKESVQVSYLTFANPYNQRIRQQMNVFGFGTDDIDAKRIIGLARIGYGFRNISDGIMDFGWKITDKDFLKLSGTLDGWKSKLDKSWRSDMFNSNISVGYTHQFRLFEASVKAGYGYSRYNYMPGSLMDSIKLSASNLFMDVRQGEMSGYIRTNPENDVSFYLSGSGEWMIRDGLIVNGTNRNNKEGLVRIGAGFNKRLDKGSLTLDYKQKTAVYSWYSMNNGSKYTNFTTFTVTPIWHYFKGDWETDLGFNLDLRTGAGDLFHASPSARVSYSLTDKFKILGSITGGLEEYDMRKLSVISPYWSEQECIRDGYTTFNALAGVSYSEPSAFSSFFGVGYRYTVDEVFQVAYDSLLITSVLKQQDAKVLYVKGALDWMYLEKAQFKLDFIYNNYLGSYLGHKMELKPAIDVTFFGKYDIMKGLDAMVTYRLMGFHRVSGEAMPVVNDLSLTANYDWNRNISFYSTVKHMLGGNFYYYAGYRTLKPSILVGVTCRF